MQNRPRNHTSLGTSTVTPTARKGKSLANNLTDLHSSKLPKTKVPPRKFNSIAAALKTCLLELLLHLASTRNRTRTIVQPLVYLQRIPRNPRIARPRRPGLSTKTMSMEMPKTLVSLLVRNSAAPSSYSQKHQRTTVSAEQTLSRL